MNCRPPVPSMDFQMQAEVKVEASGVFSVVVPAKRHTTLGLESGQGEVQRFVDECEWSWFVPADPLFYFMEEVLQRYIEITTERAGCLPCLVANSIAKEMDTSADVGPVIVEVKRGAVGDFNQLNPVRTIQPFDMIVQMADTKGTKAGCGGRAHG